MSHLSVLPKEIITAFETTSLHTFIDGTLGAGGHAKLLLENHPEITQFIGIDQDKNALKIAEKTLAPFKEKCRFIHSNFSEIGSITKSLGITEVSGILLDLGVSSMQLDQIERGFSFHGDGPLDMRMNQENPLTAQDIVNEWPEKEIADIMREFGEVPNWRQVAKVITKNRPIKGAKQLAELLYPLYPPHKRKGKNPLALPFQALRIAVNQEITVVKNVLQPSFTLLEPGGRLAVISFHRLEDRIVKSFFQEISSDKVSTKSVAPGIFIDKDPLATLPHKRAIKPTDDEIAQNPRARSSRLRIAEKIKGNSSK